MGVHEFHLPPNPLDRRRALIGGLSLLGGAAAFSLASCASNSSSSAARRASAPPPLAPGKPQDRTLVLVELYGGNDGLETIVPFSDGAFFDARPRTHVDPEKVLAFDDLHAFHPALQGFFERYGKGQIAIVQGVGYPRPVYSHFKSLEIWNTGREDGRASGDGWIGRLRDSAWGSDPRCELVVHVGEHVPYSIHSSTHENVAFGAPENFVWVGNERELEAYGRAGETASATVAMEADANVRDARAGDASAPAPSAISGRERALGHLRETLRDAQATSPRILSAVAAYRPRVEYADEPFARSLRAVAAMMNEGFGTRVYSVALGNFDTHGPEQVEKHASLLTVLDSGLGAFLEDLDGTQLGANTLVVCYSEFGRRVRENDSLGTDHGAAGPVFVLGPGVRGGLYGEQPSLRELDQDGNLVYNVDFRRVYASVLGSWFDVEPDSVLPRGYEPLPLIA